MKDFFIYALRKLLNGGNDDFQHLTKAYSKYFGQEADDIIYNELMADKPSMIARFGSVELNAIINYKSVKKPSKYIWDFIKSDIVSKGEWSNFVTYELANNAGFFPYPVSETHAEQFSKLMLNDMKEVDILGSWLVREKYVFKDMNNPTIINFEDLEPYRHNQPWSRALAGKKVLVIHPFIESIEEQFKQREKIFTNPDVLPNFELHTIKAVQTLAGNYQELPFANWFEALDSMKQQMDTIDYDIAIIGCGGYGFPLAAHAKRQGKKAVHLGGATQLLFGIMGKRWEEDKEIQAIKTKYWTKPKSNETPKNHDKVEKGIYW